MQGKCVHRLTLSFSVVCTLVMVLLSACGSSQTTTTTQAGKNQPLSFSFYSNYDWMSFGKPWGSDDTSKWIQQNKKVTINFINSNGAATQKFNQMIASNSLPDAIMTDRGASVDRLVKAHDLVALDQYLTKYPNIKKYVGDATLNLLRSSDGHLYQIPNWYIAPDGHQGQYWTIINTSIYKALGSPTLNTFDDLESYLQQVKAKYPNVTPLDMAGGDVMCSAFKENINLYDGALFGYPDGNKLSSFFEDPTYKQCMEYTNKLYREKLLAQDLFTHTQDQVTERFNNSKIAVYMGWDGSTFAEAANSTLKTTFSNPAYQAIPPIYQAGLDPKNINPGYFNRVGWNVDVITKKAKDPEAIFAYFDWATSPEGQRVLNFGPPGLFWDKTNSAGVPLPNARYAAVDKSKLSTYGVEAYNFVGNTTFVDTSKQTRDSMLPADQRDWATNAQATIVFTHAMDTTEFTNITPDPTTPEGIAQQRLTDMYKQALAKMVLAGSTKDVDSILQQTDQNAKSAGIDQLLAYETQQWQANRKQMGLQ